MRTTNLKYSKTRNEDKEVTEKEFGFNGEWYELDFDNKYFYKVFQSSSKMTYEVQVRLPQSIWLMIFGNFSEKIEEVYLNGR